MIIEKEITAVRRYEIRECQDVSFVDVLHNGIYAIKRGEGIRHNLRAKIRGMAVYEVVDLSVEKDVNGYNVLGIFAVIQEEDTGEYCAYLHEWSGYDEFVAKPFLGDQCFRWVNTFHEIVHDFVL